MSFLQKMAVVFCVFLSSSRLIFGAELVDCPKKSLAREIEKAKSGDTISFTGVCAGPITIQTDDLTLKGSGAAVIYGDLKQHALVVEGPRAVSLLNFEVQNGLIGILGQNGASISMTGVTTRNNNSSGISLQNGSSATVTNSTTRENLFHGLDLQTGSSAVVTGTFTSSGNRVFGINANGSSLTFAKATATVTGNAVGVQVATSGNAFLNDSATVLEVMKNIATGLTIVSGAHMVSFGGKINATGNGVFGVSVNSKAGLDLDAGSILTASNNGVGGVTLQQQSVMTVFNNPQFSNVPGFSTINSTNHSVGNGIAVLTGSTLTLANQAQINSTGNATGLFADNGSGVTLRNTTLTGNSVRDLRITFGARMDVTGSLTFTTLACDSTVFIRGVTFSCPQ